MAGNCSTPISNRIGKGLFLESEDQVMSLSSDESFLPTSADTNSDICSQSRSAGSASPSGTKRSRTHYTPRQICILESRFAENEFPSAEERAAMARELDVKIQHIQVWFQNRRAKHRRKKRKGKAEDTAVRTPKPPPFWPQHLPFDSNFTNCPSNKKNAPSSSEASMVSSPASPQSNPISSPAVGIGTLQDCSDADQIARVPKQTTVNSPHDTCSCQEQQSKVTSHGLSLLQSPFLSISGNPSASSLIPEESSQLAGCSVLPDLGDDSLEAFLRQADFTASHLGEGPLYIGEEWDAGVLSSLDTVSQLPTAQLYSPHFQTHPTVTSSQVYQRPCMFTSAMPAQETWPQNQLTYSSYTNYDPHRPKTTSAQ